MERRGEGRAALRRDCRPEGGEVDIAAGGDHDHGARRAGDAAGQGGGQGHGAAGFNHELQLLEGDRHGAAHLVVARDQAAGQAALVDREGDLARLLGQERVADRTGAGRIGQALAGDQRAGMVVEAGRFGAIDLGGRAARGKGEGAGEERRRRVRETRGGRGYVTSSF